ncbi:MAG: hypothetical protein ACR2I2_13645 [Bryobacteraceae bacterium]
MKTFDELTEEERDRIFESIDGTDTVPDCDLPDGTRYVFDYTLYAVVEMTPDGRRFIVSVRDGELARIRELRSDEILNLHLDAA